MVPDERLQALLAAKDVDAASASCAEHNYSEGWEIIDGALVIFDCDEPPVWLAPVIRAQNEDGDTGGCVHVRASDDIRAPILVEYSVGSATIGAAC